MAFEPPEVYVTHFGRLRDLRRLAGDLERLIDAHVALAERHRGEGVGRGARLREGIERLILTEGERQRWALSAQELHRVFGLDIELNAQGLEAWLDATERNNAN